MARRASGAILAPVTLHLYLLGPLRIERDGQLLRLPRRKVELLLAYLLLHPEQHPREKLAALFWGDFSDAQARASLRNALAVLRKELGEQLVLTEHERVQLNPDFPLWADATEFQRADSDDRNGESDVAALKSRVGLYRGDLLTEFYDDWVILERERLLARFEQTMQQLLEQLVRQQRWPEVLEWAERWIALGRTPEPAFCALMIAYADLGDRSKIATVFQRCAEALRSELGLEPSEETRTLYEQLSKGEKLSSVSLTLARRFALPPRMFNEDEPPEPGEPPYKGLQYFEEKDADFFFGRELLIAKLVGHLREKRFLAVIVGASGSGKSSIVRAGLVAALKRGEPLADGTLPPEGSQDWTTHVITPTAHPLQALPPNVTDGSESATQDPEQREGERSKVGLHTLLVVDQFEELFTLCHDETERKAFVESLMTAASPETDSATTVVITLRADFYAHCAQYPRLREAVATHQEYIGPMSTEELRHAIEEPARRGGWEFEPGLVDLILRDVGDEPGALPLLSHALLETWKRRRGHFLTLTGYAESGGVRGALAKTAESVYRSLPPEQQGIARRIFLRLTELGEGTEDTRRRASFKELIPHPEAAADVQEVLRTLADARLITMGEATAEVAHEALIREWPTLREWLTQDREGLRVHRHLTQSAQEWEELGRDAGALYRGARLAQARDWALANPDDVNDLERAFLEASQEQARREEAEREAQQQRELVAAQKLAEAERERAEVQSAAAAQLRRRALFLAGAFVIALVMAGAAWFFADQAQARAIAEQDARLRAEQEQRTSFSRELAAAAISNLDADPERSILLASHAISVTYSVDKTWTKEAEDALHRAVPASRVRLTLSGHTDLVIAVAFSPDGARVATASADGTAKVWDASTGEDLLTLSSSGVRLEGLAFSPDGRRLATTSRDKTAIVWDAATGEALLTLRGHTAEVWQVAFSPDGARLATTSEDKTAKVWDAATGRELLTLSGHEMGVAGIAFSPDGRTLATSSDDQSVRVWDATSGEEVNTWSGLGPNAIGLVFTPDGTHLITSDVDGATVWEVASGEKLLTMSGHTNNVWNVALSPDGRLLATAGQDRKVRVWDAGSGRELFALSGHTNTVRGVAFSPDGRRVASASWDGTAKVWDVTPSHELVTMFAPGGLGRVAWSPDGTRVVEGFAGGTARVWDVATGRELLTLSGHGPVILWVAWSPDGERIATASPDRTAKVWDASTGEELLTLSGHEGGVVGVAFSPDGERIATSAEDGMVKVWNASTGRELLTLSGHKAPVLSVTFGPDGTRLVSGDAGDNTGGEAILWDANTGAQIHSLLGHKDSIWGVAYSPDGTRVATACRDGTAKLWDASTGKEALTLTGHTSTIVSVAFNPDGTRVATASRDGTAKLWDVAAGVELLTLYGDGSGIGGVAFSPDGKRLATGGDTGVRVYVLPIEELMALAQSRLTRTWTPEECREFLHMEQCP